MNIKRISVAGFLATFSIFAARADCVSPVGTAGTFHYNVSSSVFEYCDGADWVPMNLGAGSACTPATQGALSYCSGSYNFYDGAAWRSAKGTQLTTCPGLTAGTMLYSGTNGMQFCDGTNWWLMRGPSVISVSNASGSEGNNVVFTVQLSSRYFSDVTFHYATSDGTAVAGTDYTATSGNATISAGTKSVTINVPTTLITTDKPAPQFTLTLSSIAGATAGTTTATGTINGCSLYFDASSGSIPATLNLTRSTTGTYINSSGVMATAAVDAPRFEYDPSTLGFRGLLVEPDSQNSALYSEAIDNAAWTKTTLTATADTAQTTTPRNDNTAELLTDTGPSGTAHTSGVKTAAISFTPLWTWTTKNATIVPQATVSVYVKPGSASPQNYVQLKVDDGALGFFIANFNLSTGAVIGTSASANPHKGTAYSAHVENAGNGWYRVSVSGIPQASTTTANLYINYCNNTGTTITTTGTTLYVWGAQFEPFVYTRSSYIPTTNAIVQRNTDLLKANNFSSWYSPTGWTVNMKFLRMFWDVNNVTPYTYPALWDFVYDNNQTDWSGTTGADGNRISAYATSGGTVTGFDAVLNGTQSEVPGAGNAITDGTAYKSSISQVITTPATSDLLRGAINGTSYAATSSNTGVPTNLNDLFIATRPSAWKDWSGLNGYVIKFCYRPQSFTQATLTTMSSAP